MRIAITDSKTRENYIVYPNCTRIENALVDGVFSYALRVFNGKDTRTIYYNANKYDIIHIDGSSCMCDYYGLGDSPEMKRLSTHANSLLFKVLDAADAKSRGVS